MGFLFDDSSKAATALPSGDVPACTLTNIIMNVVALYAIEPVILVILEFLPLVVKVMHDLVGLYIWFMIGCLVVEAFMDCF